MSLPSSDACQTYRHALDLLRQAGQASLSELQSGRAACLDATREFWRGLDPSTGAVPSSDPWGEHAEAMLTLARQLYLTGMHMQSTWMLTTEKLAALGHAQVLNGLQLAAQRTPEPHQPAVQALRTAVTVSSCACDALSKATRQVSQFAGTNLTAATLHAFSQAREQLAG